MANRGVIPWSDVASATGAIKTAAEMLMAENLMKTEGIEDCEPGDHILGEDGGVNYQPNKGMRRYRNRKTVVRQGITPKGPIKETTVTVEGDDQVEDKNGDDD